MTTRKDTNPNLLLNASRLLTFVLCFNLLPGFNQACAQGIELQAEQPVIDYNPIEVSALTGGVQVTDVTRFGSFAHKMTADDYRSLNYGVLGIQSERSVFGGRQTITAVHPGCPAALAGIQPGDIEIQTNDHVWNKMDNQRSNWNISDGEAGTPVEVTIQRQGQLMTFHLIRMNIEDVPTDSVRRMFEGMLRRLGPPQGEGAVATNRQQALELSQSGH